MPRRRALRLLGGSLVAFAVSSDRAGAAGATTGAVPCDTGSTTTMSCQTSNFTKSWCCEKRRYLECGRNPGECIDNCQGPGLIPCGSGVTFDCCRDTFRRVGYVVCKNGKCVPTCKALEELRGGPLVECGDECCTATQECENKRCVGKCPPRRRRCGGQCCESSQECRNFTIGSTPPKLRCIKKCGAGKRRCFHNDFAGECCPKGFPCCGESCGCEVGEECVRVPAMTASGYRKVCRKECVAPKKRCHYSCCTPDRMFKASLPDGRAYCVCKT
jgi:hypothetical protein